jgi:uncharacterized repeat protein (TIGR03803 family)
MKRSGIALAMFALLFTGTALAQLYRVIHDFNGSPDGQRPLCTLLLNSNTLYGTTDEGGGADNGTIFKVTTDGSGYVVLKSFSAVTSGTNADGINPSHGLALIGSTLYGAAQRGGSGRNGTVFKLNTDGSGFTVLKHFSKFTGGFTNNDGANPEAAVITAGEVLYGTTRGGGVAGGGTVFRINTNGGDFTVLKHLSAEDGVVPSGPLLLSGDTIYGTTITAGSTNGGGGTLFKLNTNGSDFTILKHFSGSTNGSMPVTSLVLDGDSLFGTTASGGGFSNGMVFRIQTNGSGFQLLHRFSPRTFNTNADGVYPNSGLVLDGNTLYGMTWQGGLRTNGTLFKLKTDGTGFAVLWHFGKGKTGVTPIGTLVLGGDTLYGTTYSGGPGGGGVVFGLTVQPAIEVNDPAFGVHTNQFGFNITGIVGQTVVIEASTNLVSPAWIPLRTTVLGPGANLFNDPAWSDYSQRFYRIRSQ